MMTRSEFIESELIASSIRGAFQRGRVYIASRSEDEARLEMENIRTELRNEITVLLRRFLLEYKEAVTSDIHKNNIEKIAAGLTTEFAGKGILYRDKFRIGTAQKLLNLYLKYMWCLGKVATPPHCPFDSRIIAHLPLTERQKQELQWTRLDSLTDYQVLVDAAYLKIQETGEASLAEWELGVWSSGFASVEMSQENVVR